MTSTSNIPTSISPTMSSPRPYSPPPSGSLAGRHVIYRGLDKSSMEYMSLTHSRHADAAHMVKGEILLSGQRPGYIQYTIVLDHQWMTRKVKMSAMFGGQEKRLVLEVDQDQRWYKVTEHRLARTRSFYRSGLSALSQLSEASPLCGSDSPGNNSHCSMQDADANLSDSASCYSSSSDSECSIPFEKINLTWTPPPKGAKRASKRFSSLNLLGSKPSTLSAITPDTLSSPTTAPTLNDTQSKPSSKTASLASLASPTSTTSTASTPTATAASSPTVGFAPKPLTRTSSMAGSKKYEHLTHLDGCVHLDLGYDISPSTLLFPLRRATLGVEPENMRKHLESLSVDDVSCTSTMDRSALVSFPDLEMRAVQNDIAFAGPGHKPNFSYVECWQDEEEDSNLVEVDGDGLVVRYGHHWARIPSS
ncbi:hypothetical protein BGZ75_004471 [Mortierella antarctica]|nr:hypothetical protein BGZ75_004471 [Mortierella antarctica]